MFNRGRGISGSLHAIVDIHFTVFTDDHGLLCVCVCVCVSTHYLTKDYSLPLRKSIIGHIFLHACLCDLLPNGGSLTIVDVQRWCVSTVTQWFFWCVSMVEGAYKCTHTHTHTHTQYKHTCTNTYTTHIKSWTDIWRNIYINVKYEIW